MQASAAGQSAAARDQPGPAPQTPPPLLASVQLAAGPRAHPPAPRGAKAFFVIHHAERYARRRRQPAGPLIATTQTEFTQSSGLEIAQQFARSVELRMAVERNADAVTAARQRLMGDIVEKRPNDPGASLRLTASETFLTRSVIRS